ncbi:genomic island protein [Stenotrophomonas maltophilia]|uniref:portal protein n=1 Tax=Stenotrophomonas maltophilia TaxID=40324 RepID=UPI0015DE8882|nr:genomic island protein [Stenotrophomonas maltophilia]MBA0428531.1 genomic island protein [Stenotrophomonas maltophilia]
MSDVTKNRDTARDVFWRLDECYKRGHEDFMATATRLDDYYLGAGRQWDPNIRQEVEADGRPAVEVNMCMQAVNAAVGYQIQNRVDMAYLPKGGQADEQRAKVISKVIKHALGNTQYRFHETDSFLDGLIQQRGYLDLRMNYDDNDEGEVSLTTFDPRDVLPDPDATSYNPDSWADCSITRWLTHSQIEQNYGKDAADEIRDSSMAYVHNNWGDEQGMMRDAFGNMPPSYAMNMGWYGEEGTWRRYRVVDRQSHEYQQTLVAKWPATGDLRIIEGFEPELIGWLIEQGVHVMRRRIRRVRWQVCAPEVCVYDKLSPYDHFTVIPYFPYFRRGKTVGMLDNAAQVQDLINKFVSQYAHIVNASANGGWQGEANSLENMTDDEFTQRGGETGLVLLRKPGTQPFQKIEPNQPPRGIENMIDFLQRNMQTVTAVNESAMGQGSADMSGIAIQSRQFAAQQALGIALDNLSRTRQMLAERTLKLVQRFYTAPRVIRIAEPDEYGVERRIPLLLNMPQDDGTILNDLTIGEYDVEVSEQPYAVTFDNGQLEQMERIVSKMGVQIPPQFILKASTLADKTEIANALREAQGKADPVAEAEAELKRAQARLADNTAVGKAVEAQFSALRTAEIITAIPQTAEIADALLRSSGFKDQDAAPIVPQPAPGALPEPEALPPASTHPLTPDNPEAGITAGMQSQQPIQ